MDVVNFLPKEFLRIDFLHMVTLLPKAIVGNPPIISSSKVETVEHPSTATLVLVLLQNAEDLFVRKLFEVAKDVAHRLLTFRADNHVKMIRHKHPGIDFQAFLLLTVVERFHNDMTVAWAREDIYPIDDCRGCEIELLGKGSHN